MRQMYVAIADNGDILGLEPTIEEAIDLARHVTPGARLAVEEPQDDHDLRPNPVAPARRPKFALAALGIDPLDRDDVMSLSVADAHAQLQPFFADLRRRTSDEADIRKYESVSGMASAWIGDNFKLQAGDPRGGSPAWAYGLSLVPAAQPLEAAKGTGQYGDFPATDKRGNVLYDERTGNALPAWPELIDLRKRWKKDLGPAAKTFTTFCTGSNDQCRNTCLVFAGQNAAERYNTTRKVIQSIALLRQPRAFVRMLVHSIEEWLEECELRHHEYEPFFRPNMLSDIPWELLTPWLFDYFRDRDKQVRTLQFYDYTKVPGRNVGAGTPFPNYDMTFSFSGSNFDDLVHDFANYGRRFSVVLLGMRRQGAGKRARWEKYTPKSKEKSMTIPLPAKFWGCDVIDGDASDIRPRDEPMTCVALRYKTIAYNRLPEERRVDILAPETTFVSPIYYVPGEEAQHYSEEIAKAASGAIRKKLKRQPDDDWLMAAHAPRHQPIDL